MTRSPKVIDADIALFLSDAGSEHQAFSKQVLRDYLATEGHDEREILEALNEWSSIWVDSTQRDDEFYLQQSAWAKVDSLRHPHTIAHWAVARFGQENLS